MARKTCDDITGGRYTYIFQRADSHYPFDCGDDLEAIDHARLNPETLFVFNKFTGQTVYENPSATMVRPKG